jgi:competence protein ComEC
LRLKHLPIALIPFACASLALPAPSPARATAVIYWVDVDGGGATLIVTPAGESVLIDSGENKPLHASRIAAAVTRAGLKQIDHFVVSHWHADHYGGTLELTKLVPIRNYYANSPLPDSVPDDPAFQTLMPLYRKTNHGTTRVLKPGDTIPLRQAPGLPAVSLRVLAASRNVIPTTPGATPNAACSKPAITANPDDGENAKSLALLFEYGKFRFFDAGDLTWHIEDRLACPNNLVGAVDLYQVTHHGLDRSNNPHLVHALHPRVAVVNNSTIKGAEVNSMRTLKTSPGITAIWQLYTNKQIEKSLNTAQDRVANPPGGPGGNYLKSSVRADGSFSVQAGDNGHHEEYPARR